VETTKYLIQDLKGIE